MQTGPQPKRMPEKFRDDEPDDYDPDWDPWDTDDDEESDEPRFGHETDAGAPYAGYNLDETTVEV